VAFFSCVFFFFVFRGYVYFVDGVLLTCAPVASVCVYGLTVLCTVCVCVCSSSAQEMQQNA
jgi:hypothetical protein